jgi:hypothetical protein
VVIAPSVVGLIMAQVEQAIRDAEARGHARAVRTLRRRADWLDTVGRRDRAETLRVAAGELEAAWRARAGVPVRPGVWV